ncbi:tryptophan-rich sensory protein [Candidatus Woesearchaeota archaeon]|nr:tryptophan-rich sensory protein [Candidatus Woesearchaeota archaeon]
MVQWVVLVICVVLCLGVGFLSSFFTDTGPGSWYDGLNKPSFNPPNWLFGPVWTLLYIFMGVVLYLLWMHNAKLTLIFFIAQLVLNFFWSFFFFTMQAPLLAFIEIVILLGTLIYTMVLTYPVSTVGFYLLIPYALWVTFASILNLAIYLLN